MTQPDDRRADGTSPEPSGLAADLLPTLARIADSLERIAGSLERISHLPAGPSSVDEGRFEAVMAVRRAVDERRWDLAARLVQGFVYRYGETPEARSLAEEVAEAHRSAAAELKTRLEAARQANDPDAAIGFRDALAPLLRSSPEVDFLEEVDRPLVRWLITVIQRRLRTGTVAVDVVELAARVASSFEETTEGASLRASLPTLRRSAGLCPRCAEPYRGVAAACPKCLAAAVPPVSTDAAPATGDKPSTLPDDEDADLPQVHPDPFHEFD